MVTPIKVAKIIGTLIIISSAPLFVNIMRDFSSGQADLFGLVFYLIIGIITLLTGYGLYKSKVKGIFGLGILGVFQLVMLLLYTPDTELSSPISWLLIVLYLALFVWFYSTRKQFSR